MAFNDEGSSITMSGTKVVTGPTETGSTISPNIRFIRSFPTSKFITSALSWGVDSCRIGGFDEGYHSVDGLDATQGKNIVNPRYEDTHMRLTSNSK